MVLHFVKKDQNQAYLSKQVIWLYEETTLAQGAATGDIPSTKPKFPVTRPEQLFLRSYGDSRGGRPLLNTWGRLRGERAGEGGQRPR